MRKGFTLIELLAVIVILAIIALIAVPIVINIINDAKEEANKRSVQNYLDSVTASIAKENLRIKYNPDECTVQSNNNIICSEKGNILDTQEGKKELKIQIKGHAPTNGIIKLNNGKIDDVINLFLNDKYYNYDINKNLVVATTLKAGLYDSNKNLLASWDDLVNVYNLDIIKNYGQTTYDKKDSGSMYDVLNNNKELKNGKILIIEENSINTRIGSWSFSNCKNLTSVIIPSSVKTIENWAFSSCINLKSMEIPEGVKDIGNYSFSSCSGLAILKIPSTLRSFEKYTFSGCKNLSTIEVNLKNPIYEDRGSNAVIKKSSNTLVLGSKNTIIPDGVLIIDAYAFNGISGLTTLTIPASVTSIKEGAFYSCKDLNTIIFKQNSNLTTIGASAFYDTALSNLQIPSNVISIGNEAFSNCKNLKSVTIPNGVINIGSSTFINCENLTSILIPETVTTIGPYAFHGTGLTSIQIPASVTKISSDAFSDCSNLTSIEVDPRNSIYEDRNSNAIIEKETNTLILGCRNTIIPSNVTTIGESAFRGCGELTNITIPNNIRKIGRYAFWMSDLTSIVFENTSGWYFANSFDANSGTNIDVTDSTVNANNLVNGSYYKYLIRH